MLIWVALMGAGVVGDIPVRVGDSATRSTVLTTIDQATGLEVYINVPVQQAQNLKVGLPVHLIDDRGQILSTETVSFVAPNAPTPSQAVVEPGMVLDPVPRTVALHEPATVAVPEPGIVLGPVASIDSVALQVNR